MKIKEEVKNQYDDIEIVYTNNEIKHTMLSSAELIKHMKNKGITFNLVSEDDAIDYMDNNNNYFKLSSFRKNYDKDIETNKYKKLDFAYLKDMAIIDMKLRYLLLQLCMDIEHFAKVELLKIISSKNENGFSIVDDYFESLSDDNKERAYTEISRSKRSEYCGHLVEKYKNNYPVWVLLEIIPFGQLVMFYRYCANRYQDKGMIKMFYMLLTCKEIRNAAAHNTCILNNLRPNTSLFKIDYDISKEISNISEISKETRRNKLSNSRIAQIVTLFYAYTKVVKSKKLIASRTPQIKELLGRMNKNIDYYNDNDMIKTSFDFITTITKYFFNIID